jgi:hypothetical protein
MQAQQCGDVLANSLAFHNFVCAREEVSGFTITLLPPAYTLATMRFQNFG